MKLLNWIVRGFCWAIGHNWEWVGWRPDGELVYWRECVRCGKESR